MARLTRDTIVTEAIALADAGGLDGVSMRKIADALGAGVMSLYRHVPDKDALLAEMASAIGHQFPYPPELLGDPDWRARVHIAAAIDMDLYTSHPWVLLAHAAPRAAAGEPSVRCFDWLVEAFTHLTRDVPVAAEFALHIWTYVQGAGLGAVGAQLLVPGAAAESGFVAGLRDNEPATQLPRLAALRVATRAELSDPSLLLTRGVDALCDGFAARAAR
ncbi:TetR/AcrR family transcriptional regulator [Tsukamurella soli]|uniref:TetR/AcrR family transcriptional regulator n=1 Tax=Tsukamurella soli TaxID=644556 RepID=A0ABP8J7W0_9ACTN